MNASERPRLDSERGLPTFIPTNRFDSSSTATNQDFRVMGQWDRGVSAAREGSERDSR